MSLENYLILHIDNELLGRMVEQYVWILSIVVVDDV